MGSWTEVIRARAVCLGHMLFGYRDYVFPLVLLVLALTTKPTFPLGSERLDEWMDILGIAVAFFGQACRALAIGGVQNIRRGGREKRIAAEALIRTGFFAHSRNPLYLGNLLIFCGLALIANSYWWYVLALPGFVTVYWAIVLAEEDFLQKQFGHEYADYCRTVNRFVPNLTGLHRSLVDSSFDWKRVMHKEYRICCTWMSVAIGLLIWERWEQFGYAARRTEIWELLLVLLTISLVYGGAWWWKKNEDRRLSPES